MTPAERALALAGFDALEEGKRLIPGIATAEPFLGLGLAIARTYLESHPDPESALLEAHREASQKIQAFAAEQLRRKFPEG
jgi:hypothetical protein